ncbi:alanine racemase [Actinotalea sp. BY-33]|uniref:Alanine racemase n=1 Tax=Actinotalea soli TaxID=2819234 RepID=A0A939LR10_9CELL|nr:alanine racemase [Actinotalea soli]
MPVERAEPTTTGPSGPALHVDAAAIEANVRTIRSRTDAQVMAVVKADGFGHGMLTVARAAVAAGASWLGVTDVADAALLRRAGITQPVLSWLHPGGIDVDLAARTGTDVAVGSVEDLQHVVAAAPSVVRVHLHLDTGMARGGLPRADWPVALRVAQQAQERGRIRVVGLMGHLPDADHGDPARNRTGIGAYAAGLQAAVAAGLWPLLSHLGTTAATLTDPATHFEMVRIGAGLVGIDPSGTTSLRGAATLTAPVVHTTEVPAGTPVGYGGAHVTTAPTHLSVLGVGYGDGIPRELAAEASVGIDGRRYRVVGRVSMDQVVVDTGARAFPQGTTATVFGPRGTSAPTIKEWAGWAGTIPHAIVTGIGPRVPRQAP